MAVSAARKSRRPVASKTPARKLSRDLRRVFFALRRCPPASLGTMRALCDGLRPKTKTASTRQMMMVKGRSDHGQQRNIGTIVGDRCVAMKQVPKLLLAPVVLFLHCSIWHIGLVPPAEHFCDPPVFMGSQGQGCCMNQSETSIDSDR